MGVKKFHTDKRIHLGLDRDPALRSRQGGRKASYKNIYPYEKLMKEAKDNLNNGNKINFYTDENQPEFISTMTRTMNAFDTRMQTFGGKMAKKKLKNLDKFMEEKGAFIRASNLYKDGDAWKINVDEYKQPIKNNPGPAFTANFDNKYPDKTAFTNDDHIKPVGCDNKGLANKELLQTAERTEFMDELRETNIKFEHPEAPKNGGFKPNEN